MVNLIDLSKHQTNSSKTGLSQMQKLYLKQVYQTLRILKTVGPELKQKMYQSQRPTTGEKNILTV